MSLVGHCVSATSFLSALAGQRKTVRKIDQVFIFGGFYAGFGGSSSTWGFAREKENFEHRMGGISTFPFPSEIITMVKPCQTLSKVLKDSKVSEIV